MKSKRPVLLLVVPWLEVGGADRVGFQVAEALSDEYEVGVVTTLAGEHSLESEVCAWATWIYHASRLQVVSPSAFLRAVAEKHGVTHSLVNWCAAGYEALPALKELGVWTGGIVHNTATEAWLRHAVLFDPYVDRHFAVGRVQANGLIEHGVRNDKVTLAPNGVDVKVVFNPASYSGRIEALRSEFGVAQGETVVSFVGRLSPEKNCSLFIDAIAEAGHLRAFIAGDGPERAAIEARIRKRGVESRVRLLGMTNRVHEVLALSDFLFLTSLTEGSPLVVIEAMAMRVVPVCVDVGGVHDMIDNGVNGFVVPRHDARLFAECITEAKADTGRRARQTVVENFDLEGMLKLYRETLGQASKPQARAATPDL